MVEHSTEPTAHHRPLCVDLDHTLVASDMAVESLLAALRISPLKALTLSIQHLSDRAALKHALTALHQPNPKGLPYRQEVLDLIAERKAAGSAILLVTAAAPAMAEQVASHLGVFDKVFSSTAGVNLKGPAKATRLVEEFGERGFDYIGDCSADIPVWQAAEKRYLVETRPGAFEKLSQKVPHLEVLKRYNTLGARLRTVLKTLRYHQWVKNLLLFLPIFLAHEVMQPLLFVSAAVGFCAFSLCASAVYILNDIVDIESDRQHPVKLKRPIPAGEISLTSVLTLLPILFTSGLTLAAMVSPDFLLTMVFYLLLTTYYSFYLKRLLVFDIVTLALLYTLRIVAGGVATEVLVSQWLLGFSLFFFFSLAAVKRYEELLTAENRGKTKASGRGYQTVDRLPIGILGASSGVISVMILALYVNSPDVVRLYGSPRLLLGLCPPLLYWISRIWLLTNRGEMHADPIVFAIKDRASYGVGIISALILTLATF